MNTASHIIVRAVAAIPAGDEVEIHVLKKGHVEAVVVRHVATSIVYGPAGVFDSRPTLPVIGDAKLYLAPRIAPEWTVVRTFHARVRECVVSNVNVDMGNGGDSYMAAATSLLVEPTAAAQTYR